MLAERTATRGLPTARGGLTNSIDPYSSVDRPRSVIRPIRTTNQGRTGQRWPTKSRASCSKCCTCNVLCPCWVGENPDGGTCDSALAWHIDGGTIEGVDVTNRTVALSVHIPGNVLTPKSWKAAVFVDDGATDEQQSAAPQGLHRPARRGHCGPGRSDRRSRIGRARTHHVHRRRRQGPAGDRHHRRGRHHAVRRSDRQSHDPVRDRVLDHPRLAGVCREGRPLHARRPTARTAERRPEEQQRAPGSLPLRGLTANHRCSPHPTFAPPTAIARSWLCLGRAAGRDRVAGVVVVGCVSVPSIPPPRRAGRPGRTAGDRSLRGGLGADDRGDDAADRDPAARDVSGARELPTTTGPARCASPSSGMWPSGPGSGSPPGSAIARSTRRSTRCPGWPRTPGSSWQGPSCWPVCTSSARSCTDASTSAARHSASS